MEAFCAYDRERLCDKDCSAFRRIYEWQNEERRDRAVCGRGGFEINGSG